MEKLDEAGQINVETGSRHKKRLLCSLNVDISVLCGVIGRTVYSANSYISIGVRNIFINVSPIYERVHSSHALSVLR